MFPIVKHRTGPARMITRIVKQIAMIYGYTDIPYIRIYRNGDIRKHISIRMNLLPSSSKQTLMETTIGYWFKRYDQLFVNIVHVQWTEIEKENILCPNFLGTYQFSNHQLSEGGRSDILDFMLDFWLVSSTICPHGPKKNGVGTQTFPS